MREEQQSGLWKGAQASKNSGITMSIFSGRIGVQYITDYRSLSAFQRRGLTEFQTVVSSSECV